MPVLSESELTQQLDDACAAYVRAVTSITAPYVRDTFQRELDRAGIQPTWLPDDLTAVSIKQSGDHDMPLFDGLKVIRVVTGKDAQDTGIAKHSGESTFTVIDRLMADFVYQLVKLKVKRVNLPKVHVKNEAFVIEVFIYGLACVEDGA